MGEKASVIFLLPDGRIQIDATSEEGSHVQVRLTREAVAEVVRIASVAPLDPRSLSVARRLLGLEGQSDA